MTRNPSAASTTPRETWRAVFAAWRRSGERHRDKPLAFDRLFPLYLFATLAVAPYVGEQPLGVVLAFFGALSWQVAIGRWRWPSPPAWLRATLGLLAMVAVVFHFRTILGRDAGTALLILLVGIKLLELRTRRDAHIACLLIFLVLAGRFLFDQGLGLGLYGAPVVVAGLVAMTSLAQPDGMAAGPRVRLAALVLVQALPLMLVTYVLFPRLQGALWGMPVNETQGITGLSEHMRPGSIQKLNESNALAFRATFDGALPNPETLYWRAIVMWATNGHTWERGEPGGTPIERVIGGGETRRYRIVHEPGGPNFLPVLEMPAAMVVGTRPRHGLTFELREQKSERFQYEATFVADARRTGLGKSERTAALQLPRNVSDRVTQLAARWQSENNGAASIARVALEHFRSTGFAYTLEPPLMRSDPVDEFLFEHRRGFCEHYASAFVTLMRAAGVPARVVLGYLGGEIGATGDYLMVRQSDAHAWAEIWDDDAGWMRVDPTAAVAPERIELGGSAFRRLAEQGIAPGSGLASSVIRQALQRGWLDRLTFGAQLYWDYANLAWFRWVTDYSSEQQRSLVQQFGFKDPDTRHLVAAMGGLLAAILGVYLWLWQRARPNIDPVQQAYLAYCSKLARVRLVRAPNEGPQQFYERCQRARPDLGSAMGRVVGLYVALRYAPPGSSPAAAHELFHEVRRFRCRERRPSQH